MAAWARHPSHAWMWAAASASLAAPPASSLRRISAQLSVTPDPPTAPGTAPGPLVIRCARGKVCSSRCRAVALSNQRFRCRTTRPGGAGSPARGRRPAGARSRGQAPRPAPGWRVPRAGRGAGPRGRGGSRRPSSSSPMSSETVGWRRRLRWSIATLCAMRNSQVENRKRSSYWSRCRQARMNDSWTRSRASSSTATIPLTYARSLGS